MRYCTHTYSMPYHTLRTLNHKHMPRDSPRPRGRRTARVKDTDGIVPPTVYLTTNMASRIPRICDKHQSGNSTPIDRETSDLKREPDISYELHGKTEILARIEGVACHDHDGRLRELEISKNATKICRFDNKRAGPLKPYIIRLISPVSDI